MRRYIDIINGILISLYATISVFTPCADSSAGRCSTLTANVSLGEGGVFDPADSHLVALDLRAPKTQLWTEEGPARSELHKWTRR